jgi:hypothetical protein
MQRAPKQLRRVTRQTGIGETIGAAVILVLIAAGIGALLDFQLTRYHPFFSVALILASIPISLFWTLRRTLSMDPKFNPDYIRNLALASVAGQAGCLTVALVFMALFAGLFLDSRLDTHPVFTIGLVIASVPLSLYAMVRMMLSSVAAIKHPPATPPRTRSSIASDPTTSTKENGS